MSFEVLDKCKPLTLLLRECSCSGVLDVDVDARGTCSVDGPAARSASMLCVTVPPVTLAHKVGPGLQDLQTRARRILAEKNADKAEENTWIGRMVAAESIGELNGLIKSRAA